MASENSYIPERPRSGCARFSPSTKMLADQFWLSISACPVGYRDLSPVTIKYIRASAKKAQIKSQA
jgi:hypothetical protein